MRIEIEVDGKHILMTEEEAKATWLDLNKLFGSPPTPGLKFLSPETLKAEWLPNPGVWR